MENITIKNINLSDLRKKDSPSQFIELKHNENNTSKLTKLIKQKDVLIRSLKFTIDNLTSIVMNHSKSIQDINDNITDNIKNEIDENLLDKYFSKMESYITKSNDYEIENAELKLKLYNKEKQFIDINNSFNVLNKVYIDNLKKSNDEKNILLERINNLSKTMDSIRELNENKIKNIRSYYQKEIDTLKKLNETPKDFNITDNYSDKNSKL
tara:strand:+ start:2569 stop:3201 length:633 start_codon:yes stop_codon:yes gene_type:complete